MERKIKPLKRITVEQAQKYMPAKDDIYSNYIHFYTITPTFEGWDEVTYYTKKLKNSLAS